MAPRRLVEVYLDLLSQPCRAVHILLNCTKTPHTVRTVALRKGELTEYRDNYQIRKLEN